MNRDHALRAIRDRDEPWDIFIIGGGATGLGAAVDAASRNYSTLLIERNDFAAATSSRSTKLVHGGVRYLQQGNVSLVMEALRERGRLLRNAPHLVSDLAFIVPSYAWWQSPWYGIGLKVYDALAGKYGFGKSSHLSRQQVIDAIPSISTKGLRGGTRYYDGQFDDARLAINLARTATNHGATLVNHCTVNELTKDDHGQVIGATATDNETDQQYTIRARAIINATGPFSDAVRRMDRPDAQPIIKPSQGSHVVLDRSFLPANTAIMVPHTADGRVMFAIPWDDACIIGTTDIALEHIPDEPIPTRDEISFILDTANRYLARPATTDDIKSVFAGIRPLVQQHEKDGTASISRDHSILIDQLSGLITVAGGKWTTYRRMAEETIDNAADFAGLPHQPCITRELPIHGAKVSDQNPPPYLEHYGSDAAAIQQLAEDQPALAAPIHETLNITKAQIAFACRDEMARTVEDALSRRSRALILDARAANEAAPTVAALMAEELGRDPRWIDQQTAAFKRTADRHRPHV